MIPRLIYIRGPEYLFLLFFFSCTISTYFSLGPTYFEPFTPRFQYTTFLPFSDSVTFPFLIPRPHFNSCSLFVVLMPVSVGATLDGIRYGVCLVKKRILFLFHVFSFYGCNIFVVFLLLLEAYLTSGWVRYVSFVCVWETFMLVRGNFRSGVFVLIRVVGRMKGGWDDYRCE